MGEKFYKQTTLPSFDVSQPPPEVIPKKIGRYNIETLLTKGGMSLLYLGFDPETHDPRAIKVLSPEYLNHPEMIDHFLWEAKIIAMTNHPNIVKLFDYGKWEEGLFIAMEFIRGVSVCQFLMQQSFSLKRCLDIILQVAYALCHLHTHGVIHRDLKPENILITEDGEVKVIDFGIARMHEESPRKTHQVMGTPSYMSPEQKENPQAASFSSDIFSLGIIAYELILGKLSYGMINLSLLPPGIQRILSKALAISVEKRYQDIVSFIHDLTEYYKSPEINTERPSTDLALEMGELLQKSEKALSQFEKPKWNNFEVGISQKRKEEELGLYIDFFRLPNNVFSLVCARTKDSNISSVAQIATFSGMVKSLISPHLTSETSFDLPIFAEALNTLVSSDHMKTTFHLNIIKLIPLLDTVVFLSCGQAGPLFHIPSNKNTPRIIHNKNPLIGQQPGTAFYESADTLGEGDLLVFHNLEEEVFSDAIEKSVASHSLLSTSRITESIFSDLLTFKNFANAHYPKLTIALRRVS